MKKLISYLSLFLSLISFVGCSKDDDSSSSPASNLTSCKVTSIKDDYDTYVYAYDANGKISTIKVYSNSDLTTPYNILTYNYTGNTVSYRDSYNREIGEFTLNANGKATSSSVQYYKAQDSTVLTEINTKSYIYDANGQLIKLTSTNSSQSGNYTTNYFYTWKDGNISNEIRLPQSGDSVKTIYSYYTDKSNAFSSLKSIVNFEGPDSKNLLKESKDGTTGTIINSYTYEFDGTNKPIKSSITDNFGTTKVKMNTFLCP